MPYAFLVHPFRLMPMHLYAISKINFNFRNTIKSVSDGAVENGIARLQLSDSYHSPYYKPFKIKTFYQ